MLLTIRRIGALLCVALSILAMGATVAHAAGKPTSVEVGVAHEFGGYTMLELTAEVNPNGASTSTTIELREEGATKWIEGAVHKLSGTTVKSYSEEFTVVAGVEYEIKLKASNLYGTTESPIGHHVSTGIHASGEKVLTDIQFVSSGTAYFTFTYLSYQTEVTCNESSTGRFGTPDGKEDWIKYSMYDCVTYMNGQVICEVGNFTATLRGATFEVQNPGFFPLPVSEGCSFNEYWQVNAYPFRVVDNGGSELSVSRPVSLTATGYLFTTSNPAEIAIESNWSLVGELEGTPFRIGSFGPS